MKKKLTRNIIFSLVALIAVFVVNFFLPRLMPGDPLAFLIGADDSSITAEEYDEYYRAMGLDKPLHEQFADYIDNLFHGNLGYSYHYGRDVGEVLNEKIPRTLQIAFPAWIISAVIALALGLIAGYRRHGLLDGVTSGAMVLLDAVPTFLMAMLLLIVFSYTLGWFPFGSLSSAVLPEGASALADRLKHLVLPVLSIVLVSAPKKYVMMRNVTAKAMDEKYVVYARARGLSVGRVLFRHVFPNVGQPFISMLGTSFGKILSGSIVVEMIFSIDGMGALVNRAITDMDYPMLQAALMIIAVAVIFSNLIADMICLLLDPRQKWEEGV